MAVGENHPIGVKYSYPLTGVHTNSVADMHCPPLMLAPETALFLAIDLHCSVQRMESERRSPLPEDDHVTYYVNRDSAGWVAQRVRRRVYIELKLECTRNRCRDGQKARDDWLCVYCKGSFPSKLRLTDHRVSGCPRGPVDASGLRLELPVYPNLKTAKQGKDLKLALQRGEEAVWGSLHHNSIWFDLNPELKDVTHPPPGARVQHRQFMLPTLQNLTANPPLPAHPQPQVKQKPTRTSKPDTASPNTAAYVDLEDSQDDEGEPSRAPKKRTHAEMAGGHRVFFSSRQTKPPQPKQSAQGVPRRMPSQPMRVTPIQARSPSPERVAILPPPTPAPHAAAGSARPPVSPMQTPTCAEDVAVALWKDRHQFYVKAASAARSGVKMDTPKPQLRPPIQPPGLFYLMACGLLKFDLECGDMLGFLELVQSWQNDPSFMDRLWAAYGRFHSPSHQVHFTLFCNLFYMCLFLSAIWSIYHHCWWQPFLSPNSWDSVRNLQPGLPFCVLGLQRGFGGDTIGFRESTKK
jgi:hypothetical protein